MFKFLSYFYEIAHENIIRILDIFQIQLISLFVLFQKTLNFKVLANRVEVEKLVWRGRDSNPESFGLYAFFSTLPFRYMPGYPSLI